MEPEEAGPAVIRVIEIIGVSAKSWSDTAQQRLTCASETIRRHLPGLIAISFCRLQNIEQSGGGNLRCAR